MTCTEYKSSDLPENVNKYLSMCKIPQMPQIPQMKNKDKIQQNNFIIHDFLRARFMPFLSSILDSKESSEEESLETTTEDTETTGDSADADL